MKTNRRQFTGKLDVCFIAGPEDCKEDIFVQVWIDGELWTLAEGSFSFDELWLQIARNKSWDDDEKAEARDHIIGRMRRFIKKLEGKKK